MFPENQTDQNPGEGGVGEAVTDCKQVRGNTVGEGDGNILNLGWMIAA